MENKNWFEKMPLHFRYTYYLIGGIIIGFLIGFIIFKT